MLTPAILVAGGSGLLGPKLVKKLKQKKLYPVLLSTHKNWQILWILCTEIPGTAFSNHRFKQGKGLFQFLQGGHIRQTHY